MFLRNDMPTKHIVKTKQTTQRAEFNDDKETRSKSRSMTY